MKTPHRTDCMSNQAAQHGLIALLLFLFIGFCSMAQTKTSVLGKVTDASTGEALPFVQVAFKDQLQEQSPILMVVSHSLTP